MVVHDFLSPVEPDGSYALVKIVIEDPSPSGTIAEYLSLTVDVYSQEPTTLQDFQFISSGTGDFTLAGRPAYVLEATYTDSGSRRPQDMLEVGTIDENNNVVRAVYFQAIIDSDSDSSKYWPIAEEMIKSLQFTSSSAGMSDALTTEEVDFGSDSSELNEADPTFSAVNSNQTTSSERGGNGVGDIMISSSTSDVGSTTSSASNTIAGGTEDGKSKGATRLAGIVGGGGG